MKVTLTVKGFEPLEAEVRRLSQVRFDAVCIKNMTDVYNRGKNGGTPVSTEATRPGGPHGELRMSLSQSGDTVGYSKDYAPHVEYGHRTRGGNGYVPGQRYLKKNVDTQRPIFYADLRKQLNKG